MQKRWSQIVYQLVGLAVLMSLLAACGATTTPSGTGSGGTPAAGQEITIKVATNFPTTGKDTTNGKPAENGAAMAVAEANEKKMLGEGYKLAFVPKDDVGPDGIHDPATGALNLNALLGDGMVAGIIGPMNSNVAQAMMPIANQQGIALISPSNTNQCLTLNTEEVGCSGQNDQLPTLRPTNKVTYFRIATTDDRQGPAGARYLFNTVKLKNAYVIDDTEVYGVGIANTFDKEWKALGGTILGRKSQVSATSYVALLTQIAATKPDVIYFGGLDSTGGTLLKQQMGSVPGLEKTIFAGGDGLTSEGFATTVGLEGTAVYATVASADVSKSTEGAAWLDKFRSLYGEPGAYSASAYDCMMILIGSIKAALDGGAKPATSAEDAATAKTFRQAVIDQIQKANYTGLTGTHTFDEHGDTTNRIITVMQLADVSGKPGWKPLEEVKV